MKNIFFIILIMFSSLSLAGELKNLTEYCTKGAVSTEVFLNKTEDKDSEQIIIRCIIASKKLLKNYHQETNKAAYGCGLGMGITLNYHNRKDFLDNKIVINKIIDNCLSLK